MRSDRSAVLLLASRIGVAMVAEGVEREQQFSALRASGKAQAPTGRPKLTGIGSHSSSPATPSVAF